MEALGIDGYIITSSIRDPEKKLKEQIKGVLLEWKNSNKNNEEISWIISQLPLENQTLKGLKEKVQIDDLPSWRKRRVYLNKILNPVEVYDQLESLTKEVNDMKLVLSKILDKLNTM